MGVRPRRKRKETCAAGEARNAEKDRAVPDPFAQEVTTPRGFEPLRAEPNGFLVHLLSHSDTVS